MNENKDIFIFEKSVIQLTTTWITHGAIEVPELKFIVKEKIVFVEDK